jgi:two-component sensor histidine kinase
VPRKEIDELYLNNPYYIVPDGEVGQQVRVNERLGEAELCVCGNRRGMGPARVGSLGLRLVESLSRQLGGRLTTPEVPKGTTTVLTFPYSV